MKRALQFAAPLQGVDFIVAIGCEAVTLEDILGMGMPKLCADKAIMFGVIGLVAWAIIGLPIFYSFQTAPATKQQIHAQQANTCAAEDSKNHGFWEKADCDPVAYFTLWLVGFTGVLAVSTIGLWIVTGWGVRNQNKDTRILQRAYLSVEPGGVHSLRHSASKCVAHIKICNVGNLPARNVKWALLHTFSQDHRLEDFPTDRDFEGDNIIPPGGQMKQGSGLIYLDEVDDLRKNGWYLYVWGIVSYDDGFAKTRTTRFCHRYGCANIEDIVLEGSFGIGTIIGREIDPEHARYHRRGNDGD